MGLSTFASLWRDGQNLFSGGVLGGFLAVSFRTWFSGIGAGIIFVLAALALLAGVFHVTPAVVLGWTRRRRARRREEEEEYEEPEDDYYDLPPVQPEPRPEPEPFIRASTSLTLTRLKSPGIVCLRQEAATANSSASAWVG